MRVWRLCNRRWASGVLEGAGARLAGGRWNPPGVAVAYCSATLSLALLEQLVHVDPAHLPAHYVAVPVDVPDGLAIEDVRIADLPRGWRTGVPPPALQEIGRAWAAALRTAVLRVPSAVVPQESNYLVNPAHPDLARLRAGSPEPFAFDPRLRARR